MLSLQVDTLSRTIANSSLLGFICLDTLDPFILALGWLDVRSSHVNSLSNDTAIDLNTKPIRSRSSVRQFAVCSGSTYFLVDNDTDGALVDVEHDTSSAVIVLERHTLVDRGIYLDINILTALYK